MSKRSLRKSLSRWNELPNRRTLEPHYTLRASAEAARILGDELYRKPADYDLNALYQRIYQAWQLYRSLHRPTQTGKFELDWISFYEQEAAKLCVPASRDLRRIPWVLFYSPYDNNPSRKRSRAKNHLGADALFMKYYSQWLSERGSTSSIRTLTREFLLAYPTELSTFEDLRVFLHNQIVDKTRQKSLSLQKLHHRCQQFNLLETNGGYLFLEKLISFEESVDEILCQSGFEGRLARSSFLESGIHAYLPAVCEMLRKNRLGIDQLDRFLQVIECEDSLRFDNRPMRIAIASSLLEPFAEEHPSQRVRERLNSFFMRRYGDPRLPSGKPSWSGIPEKYRTVVTRWLAQHAFDAFFRLIKETALDHHWSYRQAFWQAYLDNNTIRDAWFVLGSSARNIMRSLSEKDEYVYGTLRGAGRSQSVLLLRMYGATVLEWSHNGSCRIWLDGNEFTPELHQEKTAYYGNELRKGADHVQRHYSSESGGWQDQLAYWLRNNSGVEVSRKEYLGIRRNVEPVQPPQKNLSDLTKPRQTDLKQSNQSAIVTLTSAAKRGNIDAQYSLGHAYWIGKVVEKDHTIAAHWWSKAAKLGNAEAQYSLGCAYWTGKGLKQDHTKAVHWWSKAAKLGYAKAQYNLGSAYWIGKGLKQDHTKAVHWWSKAAKLGHAKAAQRLELANSGARSSHGF